MLLGQEGFPEEENTTAWTRSIFRNSSVFKSKVELYNMEDSFESDCKCKRVERVIIRLFSP